MSVSIFQGYIVIAYDEDKQMINRLVYEKENGTQKQFQLLEDFNQVRIVPMKKIRINLKYSDTLFGDQTNNKIEHVHLSRDM